MMKTIARRPRYAALASFGIVATALFGGSLERTSDPQTPHLSADLAQAGFDTTPSGVVSRSAPAQPAKPPPIRSRPLPSIRIGRPANCTSASNGMQASNSLLSQTATYLGSGNSDTVTGVEIAGNCTVVAVGRFGTLAGVDPPQPLVAGVTSSTGLLVELGSEGRTTHRQRSFGSIINDIAINASDELVIAGDAGLARLDATLQNVRWSKTSLGNATRVALAADGSVAALFGKTMRVFDTQGNETASRTFGDSEVNDIAIDANGVYVTGFAQRDGGPCTQLQVAWVRSYTRTGVERWKVWDWTHAQAAATSSSCADTRGLRIATGRDGGLYFAGESAGGNTIYRYQSTLLSENAPNVATDAFNSAYNTASNHITYIAKLDPATGRVQTGQLLLSRLDSTKGNTIRPRAINADEQGRVYVAGVSACCIQNRSTLNFNGTTTAAYAGGDPFVLVLSADLRTRLLWFSSANGGKGEAFGVAASRGLAVLGSRSDAAPMLLDRPVQPTRPSTATTGGHMMTWSVALP
jgi:hypothetical protein